MLIFMPLVESSPPDVQVTGNKRRRDGLLPEGRIEPSAVRVIVPRAERMPVATTDVVVDGLCDAVGCANLRSFCMGAVGSFAVPIFKERVSGMTMIKSM